jgi:molecular chaperone GrpE
MMLWGLLKLRDFFLPQEFLIDETRLHVWSVERPSDHQSAEPDGGDGPGQPAPDRGKAAARSDLVTQMSGLLTEQVRLEQKARQLQKAGGDDEFGKFVRQMMPFLDNFDRALDLAREHPPSEELNNWLKTVEGLHFRMIKILEDYGLVVINSVGKAVDLNYQEVVEYRAAGEYRPNTVIRELKKAVVFRGRLLRDAKVIVARGE